MNYHEITLREKDEKGLSNEYRLVLLNTDNQNISASIFYDNEENSVTIELNIDDLISALECLKKFK